MIESMVEMLEDGLHISTATLGADDGTSRWSESQPSYDTSAGS